MRRMVLVLAAITGLAAAAWGAVEGPSREKPPEAPGEVGRPANSMLPMQPVDMAVVNELGRRSGGSLRRAAAMTVVQDPTKPRSMSLSMYAVPDPNPKLIKKHDLVTIIIREEAEMTSDGTTDLKKDANLEAKLEEWVKLNGTSLQGGGQGDNPPGVKLGGKRNFKGEATVDRMDSFVTRITAEVVDVKPNGTFAIQARKKIKHDEEEQDYVMTGVCRAEDLTPDNTLLSTQVHNLEIITSHKGAVRDTTKRGWVPKLLDFVNPF